MGEESHAGRLLTENVNDIRNASALTSGEGGDASLNQ